MTLDLGPEDELRIARRCKCGKASVKGTALCDEHYAETIERVKAELSRPAKRSNTAVVPKPTRSRAEAQEDRRAAGERERQRRAEAAARYVLANGTVNRRTLGEALGLSPASMGRLLPYAYDRGWLVIDQGRGIGLGPTPI